jgi:hypothetical protein
MKGFKMKKLFQNITTFTMIAVMIFGMSENAQALGNNLLISTTSITTPVRQVVVYQSQSVSYANFNTAIFAQGQVGDAGKLPAGSKVALYVDPNKVNGAVGLQTGTRCSATQASADYYQNTITMDKRFCVDFNDAILDGRAVYGVVPTEAVFLHKASGERCYVTGNGGAVYMTNPASTFLRNYLVNRGAEKLRQFNLDTLFLDNLQAGWSGITARCGGSPKEYSNSSDYLTQMVGLAQYVHDNLPVYKLEGNLASATSEWDKFVFLDGAMCENCFTNWGGAWPSATRMLADLTIMDKWIKAGHKIYIISQAPDTTAASNLFTFAASLLVANGDKVNFHFGANYGQFYSLPEYQYNLGAPLAERICSGNTCVRQYEHGTAMVDFGKLQGTVLMQEPSAPQITPSATLATSIPTMIPPSPTSTSVVAYPTSTLAPTKIPPTPTASIAPILPTATRTTAPTVISQPTSAPTNPVVPSSGTTIVEVRVSSGNDDVEEYASGGMYMDSSDLELIYDQSAQVVGIRFTGVNIPKGVEITNAYIQFKVDETSSQTIRLIVNGEASANASAFANTSRNVSKRLRTSNNVAWSPLAWTKTGEMGTSQRTPNLKPIIQEIVNQSIWNPGNSIVIIITGSVGKRVAQSFEGNSSGAPLLHVEFSMLANTTLAPITATFTPVPTQLLPSPTMAATATGIIIPTNTAVPTLVTLSPTGAVIAPTETPVPVTP